MNKRIFFIIGLTWLLVLGICYFVHIPIDEGANYITEDSLLGIIILHSPWILGIYIALGLLGIIVSLSSR